MGSVKTKRGSKDLTSSPAERIRYLMRLIGISSDYALARATGVSRSTIKNIISRDRIGVKSARALGESLGVDPAWLESGFGPLPELNQKSSSNEICEASQETVAIGEQTRLIVKPPRQSVREESGQGLVLIPKVRPELSETGRVRTHETSDEESWAFHKNRLRSFGINPNNLLVFEIDGESMHPTLQPKDVVLIDLSRAEVTGESIYAVAISNVITVKRLTWIGPGKLRASSDNALSESFDVDADDLRILGRVVWIGRTLV